MARIGGRKTNVTTATAVALFTAAEVAGCSNSDPLEVIIRNSHGTSRLDFGGSGVTSLNGYGVVAGATLSFRIRSPADIPYAIATTTAIDVEMAWSGPFNG